MIFPQQHQSLSPFSVFMKSDLHGQYLSDKGDWVDKSGQKKDLYRNTLLNLYSKM